jgi:AhpD family alkylhydroperoxidase
MVSITSDLIKGELIMAKNPRELLNEFTGGLQEVGQTNGKQVNAFMHLLGAAYKPGAVDTKTKELISVAIGAYNRCEYCIVYHVYKALEAGATREEIMESAMVAVAFGGGPSMAYSVTLLKDSIDEFEKDFK